MTTINANGIELEIRGKQNHKGAGAYPEVFVNNEKVGIIFISEWDERNLGFVGNEDIKEAANGYQFTESDKDAILSVYNNETTYDDTPYYESAEETAEWNDDQEFWTLNSPMLKKEGRNISQFDENDVEQLAK
ncbi:MAG: hypothetical protein WA584_23505 [Pyrinomonadaceae bacterium]